jgi:NitT/TauT family transport system substrate-binding protein
MLTRVAVIVGAVTVALGAAACGSGSGAGGSGHPAATRVSVGYVPYSDDDALFLARQDGIFARHGLDVSLIAAASPVDVVASMISGQEQFGFVTTPVLVAAAAKGTPLKCVSTVDGQLDTDPARDGTMLVAAKGSGITSIKDLAGKKVATIGLASLNSLALEVLARRSGISPTSFQWVQMAFPAMPAALSQGHVQAAVIVSPFVNTAVAQGATIIDHPNVVLFGGGTIACLSALGGYISAHPAVVSAFHAAMDQAVNYARTHQSAAKATLAKYLSLTPAVAQKQILSTNWNPVLSRASVTQIEGDMRQFGFIRTTIPAAQLIWPPAAG